MNASFFFFFFLQNASCLSGLCCVTFNVSFYFPGVTLKADTRDKQVCSMKTSNPTLIPLPPPPPPPPPHSHVSFCRMWIGQLTYSALERIKMCSDTTIFNLVFKKFWIMYQKKENFFCKKWALIWCIKCCDGS